MHDPFKAFALHFVWKQLTLACRLVTGAFGSVEDCAMFPQHHGKLASHVLRTGLLGDGGRERTLARVGRACASVF